MTNSLALTVNIILMAAIVAGIVGLLAWAIATQSRDRIAEVPVRRLKPEEVRRLMPALRSQERSGTRAPRQAGDRGRQQTATQR